jgi:hypothetical protein
MSKQVRISLIIIGLVIVCFSIIVFGFSLWPVEIVNVHATLEPTLFAPP